MENYNHILARYWGYSEFRPLQLELIHSVAAGKDTLGLMPTGGGKSVVFQVYSLSVPGMCIVVTPLIALMKDQVENLNRRGIKALAIHSGMSQNEMKITLDNAVWGDYKFLYISPERIGSERFAERLAQMKVNLVTVDEAHCISQWGYDFRPSYLNISAIRSILPGVRFLALTATATPRVVDDIQEKLGFKVKNVLNMSFARENLSYIVRLVENKIGYLKDTLEKTKGTGIIYVRSRKSSQEICSELRSWKISSDYYHAGLGNAVRNQKQDDWIRGKTRIIVATNAFGMGIDKPDVRFVIHIDPPDSLEAYFQEAGRAGRDGKKAACVLLYSKADKAKLKKHISTTFPEIANIRKIYDSLCNYFQIAVGFGRDQSFEFSLQSFAQAFKYQQSMVYNSLKILQLEGYIEFTEEVDSPSRLMFTVSRDELYRFQVANAELDIFIKLILRSYTGLFNGYVKLDEDLLSKRAGIDRDVVYRFLTHLQKSKIIDYVPQSNTPFVYFTKERIDPERLRISKENYTQRKQDFTNRVEAVLAYTEGTLKCRSQLLLEYFGEFDSPPCHTCDVCKRLGQLKVSAYEFEEICNQIRKMLETPITYETLLIHLKGDQEKQIQVIRWLMDNRKITYRIDNKLEWTNEV